MSRGSFSKSFLGLSVPCKVLCYEMQVLIAYTAAKFFCATLCIVGLVHSQEIALTLVSFIIM